MDDDRLEYMGGRDLLDGGLITSMMVPTRKDGVTEKLKRLGMYMHHPASTKATMMAHFEHHWSSGTPHL